MPTASISFKLPEEQEEHAICLNGWKYRTVLLEIDQYLRDEVKHGQSSPSYKKVLNDVRDKLWEIINDRELTDLN